MLKVEINEYLLVIGLGLPSMAHDSLPCVSTAANYANAPVLGVLPRIVTEQADNWRMVKARHNIAGRDQS